MKRQITYIATALFWLMPGFSPAQQEGTLSLPGAVVEDDAPSGDILTPVSPQDLPPGTTAPATAPEAAAPAPSATTGAPDAAVPLLQPENETPEQRTKRLVERATQTEVSQEKKQEATELGYQPSYGSWPFSIMFTDKEISDIKKVLDYYEIQKYQTEQSIDEEQKEAQAQVEEILLQQGEKKELVYPVFQLRSIVYKTPENWTVTVNHQQYSSWDKPEKKEADELKILALTPEKVTFSWTPKDLALYNGLLQKQLSKNIKTAAVTPPASSTIPAAGTNAQPATESAAAPVAALTTTTPPAETAAPQGQYDNRKAAGAPQPTLVSKTRSLEFVLRTNQTIVIADDVIYEGRPPNVTIAGDEKLLPKDPAGTAAAVPLPADLMQQLNTAQPTAPGSPPADGAATPATGTPATGAATPADPVEAAKQKGLEAVTGGQANPKALIEKALEQGGFK